jgi:hypothetical protein
MRNQWLNAFRLIVGYFHGRDPADRDHKAVAEKKRS